MLTQLIILAVLGSLFYQGHWFLGTVGLIAYSMIWFLAIQMMSEGIPV